LETTKGRIKLKLDLIKFKKLIAIFLSLAIILAIIVPTNSSLKYQAWDGPYKSQFMNEYSKDGVLVDKYKNYGLSYKPITSLGYTDTEEGTLIVKLNAQVLIIEYLVLLLAFTGLTFITSVYREETTKQNA
jgi:hypothetical protein